MPTATGFRPLNGVVNSENRHNGPFVGYRGHANAYVKTLPLNNLSKYGAIVYVGGDGLLFEIVNGLCSREDLKTIPPIGCIPAGSGNGVLSTVCYRSG